MQLKKYEDFMKTSKVYDCLPIIYPILGLNGEAGEAAEKVKKCLRDNKGQFDEETKNAIKKELADVLWYIWAAADDMNTSLGEIMSIGMQKVKERQETNTVHGNGDDREKKKESFIANTPTETPVQIEESIGDLPKRIIAINTNDFERLKQVKYEISYISKHAKIKLNVNDILYNAKYKGASRMDGAILLQLENENDIDTIMKAIDNDFNSPCNLSINDIHIICPRAREIPLTYV